ncbi:MAG: hypothetical protein M1822_004737 [Bathelium mastoideum]|nr:MAG: hypothetical protein M1822_004737 [Bathelium mastoideum]
MYLLSWTGQLIASLAARQRNRRAKGEDVPSVRRDTRASQDLSSVLSSRDVAEFDLKDLMMPSLDTTIPCIDDGDTYGWNNNSDLTYNRDGDNRTQESSTTSPTLFRDEGKESLTGQLMKLSDRAMGATQELECAVVTLPVTVNSPVVNEAFEAANALVRIINSIPLADSTYGSSRPWSRDGSERQLPTEYSPIFLALASHQLVLALFRAICDSIKRSLGSIVHGSEPQQQTLHGPESSSAQFIMVLQLIVHLINRIGRSLRMRNGKSSEQHELTFGSEGREESGSSQSIVDSAQAMLRSLPDEHVKLSKVIQELQACIEEGVHI